MTRYLELLLAGWTTLAGVWWLIALGLVSQRAAAVPRSNGATAQSLTVFKPLAALRDRKPSTEQIAALESFGAQLDDRSEMLLGIESQDLAMWQPIIDAWRERHPQAQLKVISMSRPRDFLSPKVSWFHELSKHARGEWWMWSDSDMIAPSGSLDVVRSELNHDGHAMVTCPYVIRRVTAPPAMLEALFANAEFFPGVLAVARWGRAKFAFGAAMLFRAEDFRKRIDWKEIGARLADDNLMGKRFAPVKISDTTLETLASQTHWSDAVRHYLRWHKTVRWCRPLGFAGLVMLMPVLGWLAYAVTHPASWVGWLGLVATMQIEAIAALGLCRRIGCRVAARHLWVIEMWSLLRPLVWLACWLPWPVVFHSQNRVWWGLHRSTEWRKR